jgi:hypothetical protein
MPTKILQKFIIKALRLLGAGIGFELCASAMDTKITENEHGQFLSHPSRIVVKLQL